MQFTQLVDQIDLKQPNLGKIFSQYNLLSIKLLKL